MRKPKVQWLITELPLDGMLVHFRLLAIILSYPDVPTYQPGGDRHCEKEVSCPLLGH